MDTVIRALAVIVLFPFIVIGAVAGVVFVGLAAGFVASAEFLANLS